MSFNVTLPASSCLINLTKLSALTSKLEKSQLLHKKHVVSLIFSTNNEKFKYKLKT